MANLAKTNSALAEGQADHDAPANGARNLTLVAPPAPGKRAHELFREARSVSLEHLSALAAEIDAVHGLLESVIDAGDLYVPGVREFALRLSEDLFWRSKTLAMLSERQEASLARPRDRR